MKIRQLFERYLLPPESHALCNTLMDENPEFAQIIRETHDPDEANKQVNRWVADYLKGKETAYRYYKGEIKGRQAFEELSWREVAAIRILDYTDNAGKIVENLNIRRNESLIDPIGLIWLAVHKNKGGAKPDFFWDMIHLFRQFSGTDKRSMPSRKKVKEWMDRHPSGLESPIVEIREENKARIIEILIRYIEEGKIQSRTYLLPENSSLEEKRALMNTWWNDYRFHLKFAIRTPDMLNELLDYSLDADTMDLLRKAREVGIPSFVNPYYLSLVNVNVPAEALLADLAIRQYVIYSKELIEEFGQIVAWEKEDIVEPGKPNAAGWLLPNSHNIHRRYPEVAILIPDTVGRACGGLCTSCQRMYDFQRGNLNFNLDKLMPDESWEDKLHWLMKYYENDSQLRDILITGGDALMSSDKSLKKLLDAVLEMTRKKAEANKNRPEGQKYAEMLRVRLGTRMPVYLPQRITDELIDVLREFKQQASFYGIKQFVIQTHFISPMEITPEARKGIEKLISAGWIVTNQMVFTSAGARRGHSNKLRKVLNDIGVLTYYTFSVKGFKENTANFANNARAVQEQIEEKVLGAIPEEKYDTIRKFSLHAEEMKEQINDLRKENNIPFLATDRNVMNLPGVGKSLTFRTIGITRRGRRILEFDHDGNRSHSPIINTMGKVIVVESKTIRKFMRQLRKMGENVADYADMWGYSIGETEERMPIYEYPEYDYPLTSEMTNLEI